MVIDADVLQSASARSGDAKAVACREALEAIRQVRHFVVQTPLLEEEWDNHASEYSLDWLVQMESRRRVVHTVEEPRTGLDGALRKLPVTPEVLAIMLKDCHLLEAALAADHVVISKDEKAYAHFYHASASISQIRPVMWASPMRVADECTGWLLAGAKPETKRRVGKRPHRKHPDF
ncbi:hypothetical protein Q5H93_23445 [Hymenobacter sp. ASUV-10]|uniref:PIN domain-containing protein n=1 Tax=Hymenobacter aranciens TaxID=3063996 RepID=A0ABT9BHJ6_9BACT|nr:hypothetical protein [Hymenobacter sp. ASUV-10]